ncbi:MAG: glycine cleavage system aminomethyltransferase GcvT [bacterium]|nr:glycine cleavage system aminomethyltransferase GcvT [bacterium]
MGGNAEPGNDAGPRKLALRERHDAAGARFAPFAGWEMPLQYQGTVREHEAVRRRVGVFDVSHLGRAWLRGPRAGALLRSVTTFDVTTLDVGRAHYSLYCNDAGGIDDDVFVYHLPGERWLIVHNAANATQDFERLRSVADDAEEVTEDTVMLAVQGPDAIGLLSTVLTADLKTLAPRDCVELDWDGSPVLFARTGYTGEDGGECIIPAGRSGALWDALVGGGATPVGLGARDTLRLEAALPLHGNDIDATTHPYEAGLGFAVSLDDAAPFIGREALTGERSRPRTRRLGHLVARERGVPRAGHAVRVPGGETVAQLTSGGFSPTLARGIGMAYLPIEFSGPGTALEVDVRGRALPTEVVRRPFYRKAS